MNIFGIIILGTLFGTFLIKLVADVLNLKAAGEILPDEFRDVFDQEAYEKSQNYLRHSTVF
ncbi:MAG: M48 family peptidase, partial [Chlorobiales bacterium]|nr:M48 family peptidase [Chlorobiales bacterium]